MMAAALLHLLLVFVGAFVVVGSVAVVATVAGGGAAVFQPARPQRLYRTRGLVLA